MIVVWLQNSIPIPPPEKSRDNILLFFKLYEPEKGEFRFVCFLSYISFFCSLRFAYFVVAFAFCSYIGRLSVRSSSKPIEYIGQLNQMAGFAPDQEVELFEVIF